MLNRVASWRLMYFQEPRWGAAFPHVLHGRVENEKYAQSIKAVEVWLLLNNRLRSLLGLGI
jgi:hypothetical protein